MKSEIEIEQARKLLLERVSPIEGDEVCNINRAIGRICAKDYYAAAPVPAFRKSAMDGYAVKSEDLAGAGADNPVILKVIGEVFAGGGTENDAEIDPESNPESEAESEPENDAESSTEFKAENGTAVRIMTGAMIPEGYDAVIRQEDSDYGEDEVKIFSHAEPGMNICPIGEELEEGELVVPAGKRLGRFDISLLASIGIEDVTVLRALTVGFVSTGSELVYYARELKPGQIYDSIQPMLAATINAAGFRPSYFSTCADNEKIIEKEIKKAVSFSDVVITTGGISVGKKDLLPGVLSKLGAVILFSRAKIQPGTPTMACVLDGKPVLCLSGNPYAAVANFDFYFWSMAAKFTGCEAFLPETFKAKLVTPYEKVNRSRRLLRARYEGGKVYLPSDNHRSSVIGNLRECNCYIDLPAETAVSVGKKVKIILMK